MSTSLVLSWESSVLVAIEEVSDWWVGDMIFAATHVEGQKWKISIDEVVYSWSYLSSTCLSYMIHSSVASSRISGLINASNPTIPSMLFVRQKQWYFDKFRPDQKHEPKKETMSIRVG